jgi:uncharacterized RDD family membrane protein YckC
VERTIDVATGESVAFSYELAGLGSRFFAVFIDLAIQIGVLLVAFLLLAWIGSAVPSPPKVGPTGLDKSIEKFAAAIVEGTGVFALFMLFFGYFILFEWRWGGRTPGKRLLGIRVVRDGGFPVDFTSSVVRNVVRILEAGLGFYAVSAVVTLLSPLNQRLGDMAAGTLVVRDERYERPAAIVAASVVRACVESAADDPVVRDLAESERDLIRRYAERRAALSTQARTTLAATIAAGVRPKLAASYAHLDDDALLQFLAEHALV